MLMRKVIALPTSRRSCKQDVLGEVYQQPMLGSLPPPAKEQCSAPTGSSERWAWESCLGLLLAMSKKFKSAKEVGGGLRGLLGPQKHHPVGAAQPSRGREPTVPGDSWMRLVSLLPLPEV